MRLCNLRNRKKKNEEKQTEPQGPVTQQEMDQKYITGNSGEEREKGTEEVLEEIMTENFQNLV